MRLWLYWEELSPGAWEVLCQMLSGAVIKGEPEDWEFGSPRWQAVHFCGVLKHVFSGDVHEASQRPLPPISCCCSGGHYRALSLNLATVGDKEDLWVMILPPSYLCLSGQGFPPC